MTVTRSAFARPLLLAVLALSSALGARAETRGWLSWRGPSQNGVSLERGLPETWQLKGKNDLWSLPISGGGSPVIANGKVFALGYSGQGPDLQEVLFCADAETGKLLWERRFNDYLSDITYDRYAIGSPCIDPETGNIYALTSAGIVSCYTQEGKLVWQHAMMESFGRLTFTNGRTGGPSIEQDIVIVRGITSNWGADGAAQDRLYAFDKKTGGLVWASGSGAAPKDNSFARPYAAWRKGKRVLYTGAGDGSVVCFNARTGEAIWKFPASVGGMNASVVLYKNLAIAIHNDQNPDATTIGRMMAINVDAEGKPAETGPPVLERSAEAWRNDLGAVSSSPVLVGNRIYQTDFTGHLDCVDADTGKVLWTHKLAPDQLHASPTYADGKLYVPMQNGMFFIVKPEETGATELAKVQLEGRCIGAPAVWNGKVYVFTTARLYCFGKKGKNAGLAPHVPEGSYPKPGPATALQVIPTEVLLRPGEKASFTVRTVDAAGLPVGKVEVGEVSFAKYIPPTARVRAELDGSFNSQGELVASPDSKASAGAFEATWKGLKGYLRARIVRDVPLTEDFEAYDISVPHATEAGVMFAYPPLPWIGARFKFEVRDLGGNKVLAKTLDNIFFQRATVFLGHPDTKNYTMEADVMTDGNRRTMSSVGLVNQRYLITLEGNAQELLVQSNQERIRVGVPFKWTPKTWYRLKTRVDVAADGSGVIRAKAWPKGEAEPSGWTLEVPHKQANVSGSPGLFGFAPQSLFRCYIDNIRVMPNDRQARRPASSVRIAARGTVR